MSAEEWAAVPDETRRFVTTLGCKLEPIVQVVPATPTPLVLGFECLGLGALGESFQEICKVARDIDPGLLRLCLAVVSIKTASTLRTEAVKSGHSGARNLIFSMNVDPFMLDSPHFKKLLLWYFTDLSHNVLFEVNETPHKQYLPKLKNLQVDFNLRYSADDLNNWHPEVRAALIVRVEMTKMDYRSFKEAMSLRGDDKRRSLDMLLEHNMRDKPLIVEGIEDRGLFGVPGTPLGLQRARPPVWPGLLSWIPATTGTTPSSRSKTSNCLAAATWPSSGRLQPRRYAARMTASAPCLILDSITEALQHAPGAVVVSGSHGGP